MIDYKEICDQLKDEDVFHLLEQLGAAPCDKGSYFIGHTICHNVDPDSASRKLYYYKDTHLFYCYTECAAMSIFKFLKHYYETRNMVYDWYTDILQVVLNCSTVNTNAKPVYKARRDDYARASAIRPLTTYNKGILDVFVHTYPVEWLNDSISPAAIDKYDIRYSISQNKIIIPHFNAAGGLVGIRGRALNEYDIETFGKYMPVQIEGKWYSHPLSLNLYGLNFNKENIRRRGYAIICESEKSVLQAESFTLPNCTVASCGSNLNKFQIKILLQECAPKEIIVCYDQEELKGEHKYFDKLYKMCSKYKNYCNISFIYDRYGLLKLKDSPTDRGEDIFMTLLKRRVKVK